MIICSNFPIFNSNASSHQRLCETAIFTRLVGYEECISNQAGSYDGIFMPDAVQE